MAATPAPHWSSGAPYVPTSPRQAPVAQRPWQPPLIVRRTVDRPASASLPTHPWDPKAQAPPRQPSAPPRRTAGGGSAFAAQMSARSALQPASQCGAAVTVQPALQVRQARTPSAPSTAEQKHDNEAGGAFITAVASVDSSPPPRPLATAHGAEREWELWLEAEEAELAAAEARQAAWVQPRQGGSCGNGGGGGQGAAGGDGALDPQVRAALAARRDAGSARCRAGGW